MEKVGGRRQGSWLGGRWGWLGASLPASVFYGSCWQPGLRRDRSIHTADTGKWYTHQGGEKQGIERGQTQHGVHGGRGSFWQLALWKTSQNPVSPMLWRPSSLGIWGGSRPMCRLQWGTSPGGCVGAWLALTWRSAWNASLVLLLCHHPHPSVCAPPNPHTHSPPGNVLNVVRGGLGTRSLPVEGTLLLAST